MIVAASSGCFPQLSLQEIMDKLADLEYTSLELAIGEQGVVHPSDISGRFEEITQICRTSRRITSVGFYFAADPAEPKYMDWFIDACRLAKALKVVVVAVRAGIPGTPFNEEVERFKEMVRVATLDGVVVGVASEIGRLTEDPDTVGSLCKSVKGLGVSLDPSHYIFNQNKPREYDGIIDYVCHVRLRDTTRSQFQTLIGQGTLEYGRLVIQLGKSHFNRALCVDLAPRPDVDIVAELRKMRLLLESLL